MSDYSPVGSNMADPASCSSAELGATDPLPGEDLECKICYNQYDLERRAPKVLDCSHTFCQECLEAVHSRRGAGWRLSCPVCRHRTPVPEHRVQNLPDDAAVAATLPLQMQQRPHARDAHTGAAPAEPAAGGGGGGGSACHQFTLATGCVCATFSFLSMAALLFAGLVLVHNFSGKPAGALCLSAASALALLTLILTWLMCVLQHRHETASTPSQRCN